VPVERFARVKKVSIFCRGVLTNKVAEEIEKGAIKETAGVSTGSY
jgi:hypothetical protein